MSRRLSLAPYVDSSDIANLSTFLDEGAISSLHFPSYSVSSFEPTVARTPTRNQNPFRQQPWRWLLSENRQSRY
jgi:hypothetical protein